MKIGKKISTFVKKVLYSPLFWVLIICLGVQVVYFSQVLPYEVCGDTSSYTYQYDPSFRTPIYPMFTQFIRLFTGDNEVVWLTTVAVIQKIIMFASILLFWALVCNITKNKHVRVLATVIYGATPAIFSWAACILTETFSIVEVVALMFFSVKYLIKHKKLDAFMSGIMILLLVLTRPAAVYLLAVYAVFWGIQLVLVIRRRASKKSFTSIRAGIVGFVVAVCGVLGYCTFQKITYGNFGLSSVSYINDLLIVIDTNMYQRSSNEEIRDYIAQQRGEKKDIYDIIWDGLMVNYSSDDLEVFAKDLIRENRLTYVKKMVLKAIKWGIRPASTAYNTLEERRALDMEQIAGFLFPIPFGLVYILVLGGCVWIFVGIVRKKRLDWVLLLCIMLIGGNIAVTIIAAPYEPERLCVTSLPVLIIGISYAFEISARCGGGKRLESSVCKEKMRH